MLAVYALGKLARRNQDRPTYHVQFVITSDQAPGWRKTVNLNQDNWFQRQFIQVGLMSDIIDLFGQASIQCALHWC